MNWKYYEPKFEYEETFEDSAWPWTGHKYFAYDLIANIKPKIIVELGTHYGTSLWAFSQAVKDQNIDTEINAVDTWEGEKHAGFYGEEVFETVKDIKNKFYPKQKINLIRKTFDNAISDFKNNSIDVLHIDGLHTHEAVKHDFESWLPKVSQNGIVLFHDIKVGEMDFGVYKFWEELKEKYTTIEFFQSFGLGFLFLNKNFGNEMKSKEAEWQMHYSYIHEIRKNQAINLRNNEIENNSKIIQKNNQEIQSKNEKIEEISQVIQSINKELNLRINELSNIYTSRSWKVIVLMQKILFFLFPHNSLRRKIAGALFRFVKNFLKLIYKVKQFIFSFGRLIKKASDVLKKDGFFVFVKKSLNLLISKFKYFKFKMHSFLRNNHFTKYDMGSKTGELSLQDIGLKQKTDKAINHDFLPFYENYLNKYRHKKIRLLEIGIGGIAHAQGIAPSSALAGYGGSSLRTWEEYFPEAEIYGLDIDNSCLEYIYKTKRVKTIIGDQTDRTFLDSIEGEFDIIIDDGGHCMNQQMISFGCLFKKIKPGGVYIIEDLHTSLMPEFGGNLSNKDTVLSELHHLKTSGVFDSNYLFPEEKKYIESNTDQVFIHGFYDGSPNNNHITSVIKKKLEIKIYQIYYDNETKKALDKSLIPYSNKVKDNYFENSVILDIYDKGVNCDFVGVTSTRLKEKTKLDGEMLIKIVEDNKESDVIIYCPNYDYLYNGKRLDIWKANSEPKTPFYRAAEILNNEKVLPFDIFKKDWTYCYCNYWVVRKEIFDDYCKTVLKPALNFFEREDIKNMLKNLEFKHRGKLYPVETFVLEGLFGTYLSNNDYKIYNHFIK